MVTVAHFDDLRSDFVDALPPLPIRQSARHRNRHGGPVPSIRSTELSLSPRKARASRGTSMA